MNKEAMAHWGLLRQKKVKEEEEEDIRMYMYFYDTFCS